MNRQRRRFTTEQKAEAVGLCLRENLSILEASKRLGVHASCLGRWVKQAQIDQGGLKDSGPLTSDERIEFTRLRKENRELRREKDFFRLAAAHFAKEQLSQRGFQWEKRKRKCRTNSQDQDHIPRSKKLLWFASCSR